MVHIVEHVGGRLIDRRDPRARRRVRLSAGMDGERVEAWGGCVGHGRLLGFAELKTRSAKECNEIGYRTSPCFKTASPFRGANVTVRAACVVPERRSLIRDRNTFKRCFFLRRRISAGALPRATRRRALFDPPRSGCPAQGAKPGDLGKRFVAALSINQKVVNRSAPELFPAACLHKKMVHPARNEERRGFERRR